MFGLSCSRERKRAPGRAACLAALLALAAAGRAPAAEEKKAEGRVPVAKCALDDGVLLRREAPDKPWQLLADKDTVSSGDLLVGGPGASLDSTNGAVRLSFISDHDGTSPFPIIDTAVTPREGKDGVDFEFTMERGRVDLINKKAKGPARVRVRIRDKSGDLTLATPGTRVALELYGRWPKGVPFNKDAKPDEGPALAFILLVIEGEAEVKAPNGDLFALRAPPGPAIMQGDNIVATPPVVERLDELPAWAKDKGTSERAKKIKANLAKFRAAAQKKSIGDAIDELAKSNDPDERRSAVFIMAALDDLTRLAQTLSTTKDPDVWDSGVLALRHWIGRGPGQDQLLYKGLIDSKYTPVQAETVMQLLHSFGDDDLARPETYETLIAFLNHDKLAIRGLAYWHLYRLVPDGKKIKYDPNAPKEERAKAVQEWKKLVPAGKLPPKPTDKKEDK